MNKRNCYTSAYKSSWTQQSGVTLLCDIDKNYKPINSETEYERAEKYEVKLSANIDDNPKSIFFELIESYSDFLNKKESNDVNNLYAETILDRFFKIYDYNYLYLDSKYWNSIAQINASNKDWGKITTELVVNGKILDINKPSDFDITIIGRVLDLLVAY